MSITESQKAGLKELSDDAICDARQIADVSEVAHQRDTRFRDELQTLINSHSRENGSDTPDFILAQFLFDVLGAWDRAATRRTEWYGCSDQSMRRIADLEAECANLHAQLMAEGEHTAAANANIDRLNTEIERITRRQQGNLAGKD